MVGLPIEVMLIFLIIIYVIQGAQFINMRLYWQPYIWGPKPGSRDSEISDLDPEISVLNPGLGVFRDMDITPITDTCHGGWSMVLVVMDHESRSSMTG